MRRVKWLLFFITTIDTIGIGIVYPILTPMFIQPDYGLFSNALPMGVRKIYLGITFASYPLCMFFGSSMIGMYSDRWGRKFALTLCLTGSALGYMITAFGIIMLNFPSIILGRMITGFAAASEPVAQAVMIDMSTPKHKTKNINLLAFASSFGFVIGPLFASVLSNEQININFGPYMPFLIVTILSLVGYIWVQSGLLDTHQPNVTTSKSRITMQQAWQLLQNHNIARLASIYFLFILGWNFYYQFLSVYLIQKYGFSSRGVGFFLFFTALCLASCCLLIVRPLLNLLAARKSLVIAFILIASGISLILFTRAVWMLWTCILPLSIGLELAYITTITLLSDQGKLSQQGEILGMLGSVKSAAWVTAPLLSGIFANFSNSLPFSAAIICVLLALWFALRV